VRQFAQDVAHDVTREGPAAWRRYFSASASFFMASDGQLVFSNATSAARGIDDLTRTIKSIELRWGDDLRVDPLTPDLAVMASSWSELRVAADGGRVTDRGYFTAVAERRDGRWKFPQCPLVGRGTGAEGTVSLRERPSAGGARAGSCRMRREHCSIGSQVIPPK